MSSSPQNSALVLLSGGQDSTTCLYWSLSRFEQIEALCFDYQQRNRVELESAKKVAEIAKVPLHILPINTFAAIGGDSLTDTHIPVEHRGIIEKGEPLPNSFVPGRNLIFLTFASAFAYRKAITHLVTGVCETDFSGYPDCRADSIASLQQTIRLGMEYPITIHTPLMGLTKAGTVKLAQQLGATEALAWTHTCYEGKIPPCGECPSCLLRARGFAEAGVEDPLLVRLKK